MWPRAPPQRCRITPGHHSLIIMLAMYYLKLYWIFCIYRIRLYSVIYVSCFRIIAMNWINSKTRDKFGLRRCQQTVVIGQGQNTITSSLISTRDGTYSDTLSCAPQSRERTYLQCEQVYLEEKANQDYIITFKGRFARAVARQFTVCLTPNGLQSWVRL